MNTQDLAVNGHVWEKRQFSSNPAYCVLCFEQISSSAKGLCCLSCSIAIHIKCKDNPQLSSCGIESEHGWVRDHSSIGSCMHCRKDLPKNDKNNAYICAKCGKRAHKHCRNVLSKCELEKTPDLSRSRPSSPLILVNGSASSEQSSMDANQKGQNGVSVVIGNRPRRNSHRNPLRTSINVFKNVKQAFKSNNEQPPSPPVPLLTASRPVTIKTLRPNLSDVSILSASAEIFCELDSMRVSSNSQKRKMFKVAVDTIITRLEHLLDSSGLTIPKLLHQLTLERGHAFTSTKMQHYESILDHYITLCHKTTDQDKQDKHGLIQAIKLRNFCHTHIFDPGNVLIGTTASEDIVSKLKANSTGSSLSLSSSFSSLNGSNNLSPPAERRRGFPLADSPSANPTSRNQLMDRILAWGKIEDKDILFRAVKRFASAIEDERLVQGDIVLVEVPRSSFGSRLPGECVVYARYQSEGDKYGKTLNVLVEASEVHVIKVPYEKMLPFRKLGSEYLDMLESLRTLPKLIHHPSDVFAKLISRMIKDMTHKFLDKNHVSVPCILSCVRKNINLHDLLQLQETMDKLAALSTTELFSEIEASCHEQASYFVKFLERQLELDAKFEFPWGTEDFLRLDTIPTELTKIEKYSYSAYKPFIPTCRSSIAETQDVPFLVVAANRIRWYIGECEGAIELLKLERKDLLSGKKKRELTDWWLHLIKARVDDYLLGKEFDFDAVSPNYLEEPPRSLSAVRNNHKIILKILNPDSEAAKRELDRFIAPLKQEIYERIDLFLANAKCVLAEQLSAHNLARDVMKKDGSDWIRIVSEIKQLDPKLATWVKNIIEDIQYIREMKRLEHEKYGPESDKTATDLNTGLYHTVPITGLILGRFNRFENELRTVLDVWTSKMPKEEEETLTTLRVTKASSYIDLPTHVYSGDESSFAPDSKIQGSKAQSLGGFAALETDYNSDDSGVFSASEIQPNSERTPDLYTLPETCNSGEYSFSDEFSTSKFQNGYQSDLVFEYE